MYVTGRFPLLAAIGVVPVVGLTVLGAPPWTCLAIWLLIVCAVGAVDALLAPSPSALTLQREPIGRVRLGESADSVTWITNSAKQTAHLIVRDAWQPTAGAPSARERVVIPPSERRRFSVPLQPRRRGELASDFVAIRSAGPLRIAGRQGLIRSKSTIRVLPPFHARRHLASRVARLKELDGNTSLQVRGQGTEFDSLREYVRGDDVRSIDWRATARSSQTMLRTWRPERDRHVVIVIDTGRTSAARVGDETRLDVFFEAALLLTALVQRAGDHVHVILYDRVVRARVSGIDGPQLLPILVDAIAPIEATMIDTDWDGVFTEVRALTARPSLLVLLTANDSPASSRDFLSTLAFAARRSRVVVASATDAALTDLTSDRSTIDDIYRAAAAAQTLAEASDVARAIERAGADAIFATPDALPPRVADRYIELKKQGRL